MILKLSFWSHFQRLWILIIYCIVTLFCLWIFEFKQGMTIVSLLIAGALIVPTLIIHLNHYRFSKNRTVILLDNMIKIDGNNINCIYNLSDISSITIYMSGARYSNLSIQSFPFENYFYCKIDSISNEPLILSSIFSDKLEELLKEKYKVSFVRERTYYPYINL